MATLQRWDPFRDLANLHQDMNRLFNQSWGDSSDIQAGSWAPHMDVYETADAFVVEMDLPGMNSESIDVTLDQNLLTVRGERTFEEKVSQENYHRIERRYGSFGRTISLPSRVDAEGIQAAFRDGVLEVTVPKVEEAKPRKIKVGDGARELRG